MDLFTSVSYEIELWNLFANGRGANATIFLATVIAVWVAARFSSVMVDKEANTLAKLIGTAFAVSVFLIGLNLSGLINGTYEGHALALTALDADRDFLKAGNVFNDNLIDSYISLKMDEVIQLEHSPHPVEFKMYYSV